MMYLLSQKNTHKNIMYLLSPVITTGQGRSGAIFHDKFSLPNSRQQFYTASRAREVTCLFLFNFARLTWSLKFSYHLQGYQHLKL